MTAVEWFYEDMINQLEFITQADADKITAFFKIAKELEKQQIINAYLKNRRKTDFAGALKWIDKAEQYYNETF
jgi:hypothetical protein